MFKSTFVALTLLINSSFAHADDVLVDCVEFWDEECQFDVEKRVYNCDQGQISSWKRSNTEAFKITLKRRANGSVYAEKVSYEPGVTTRGVIVFDSNPTAMNCLNYENQWDCESNDRSQAIKALFDYGPMGTGMDISVRKDLALRRLARINSSQLCLVNGKQLP
jgi:hypothetical protein